jgi:hypothetical protein
MPYPFLNIGNGHTRRALVPASVEVFGDGAELNDQILRQILRRDRAAFFLPQPRKVVLIMAHDDAGIRAADKGAAVVGVEREDGMGRLGALGWNGGHRYLLRADAA